MVNALGFVMLTLLIPFFKIDNARGIEASYDSPYQGKIIRLGLDFQNSSEHKKALASLQIIKKNYLSSNLALSLKFSNISSDGEKLDYFKRWQPHMQSIHELFLQADCAETISTGLKYFSEAVSIRKLFLCFQKNQKENAPINFSTLQHFRELTFLAIGPEEFPFREYDLGDGKKLINLATIKLKNCFIENLSFVNKFKNLKTLKVRRLSSFPIFYNYISKGQVLVPRLEIEESFPFMLFHKVQFPCLEELVLKNIKNLQGPDFLSFSKITTLRSLICDSIANSAEVFRGISGLTTLTSLSYLTCPDTSAFKSQDTPPLINLNQQPSLMLTRQSLNQGIHYLSTLTNLISLDLSYSPLQKPDFSPLTTLTNLKQLYLPQVLRHPLSLSSISCLTQIEILNLRCNGISHLGFLKPLTRLNELNLSENLINCIDLSEIVNLTNLTHLDLSFNPLRPFGYWQNHDDSVSYTIDESIYPNVMPAFLSPNPVVVLAQFSYLKRLKLNNFQHNSQNLTERLRTTGVEL